ncbi:MAG TPA: ABC transporter ATP-binding protein [Methylomirabilota bacterium]|nr:ABC transporter ATP-binding protein [Methylomirabilota bacterium]
MSILTASKVGKQYRTQARDLVAVEDVSFSVEANEFVTLVGPSGCGKSTLLKVVGGLMDRTAGEVVFKGEPVTGPRRDIGIMFQTPVLFDWRTALENVLLPTEVLGLSRADSLARARSMLKIVDLEGFEDSYPSQLSGGMQQRVSLSRVLVYEPDLLLMDEPFGALDEFTRERLNLEIQRIWMQHKKTILFVTHNIAEAVFLSDQVLVMTPRPGRLARVVRVPFPRPREIRLMKSAEFASLVFEIREILGVA